MKKYYFLLFVNLFFSSHIALSNIEYISHDSELLENTTKETDFEKRNENITISFCSEQKELTCEERDRISRRLTGVSMFFGTISTISALCPEPFLTKAQAVIFTGFSTGTATISFFVKGMECRHESMNLTGREREFIIRSICSELDKQFVYDGGRSTGHCE